MVQVDTTTFEERLDFGIGARFPVDGVLARVVPIRGAIDNERRVRNDLERVRAGLCVVNVSKTILILST